jgi:hypothetical protein
MGISIESSLVLPIAVIFHGQSFVATLLVVNFITLEALEGRLDVVELTWR